MSLVEEAVPTGVFNRRMVFPLPKSAFDRLAQEFTGQFVDQGPWQQVLFLCSDSVVFGFWTMDGNKDLSHRILGMSPEAAFLLLPELRQLWLWKNIGRTWADLQQQLLGGDRKESPQGKVVH